MTPDLVPAEFGRVMGCTATDLLRCIPGALPGATIEADAASGAIHAAFADGALRLAWKALPPRKIALLEIPCLQVKFEYTGLTPLRRREIQRRFDLATQRGGG